MTEIPEKITELMREEEIENIQNRNGWAVGTVVQSSREGEIVETIEPAFIELFNGEGLAGVFGGVKFLAVDGDGEYRESYAYATRDAFENSQGGAGWYVESFTDPEDPDYGQPAP